MLKRTESFMKMKAAPALINLWRELDGDDAWQAAFDGVLAGVDAELIENIYGMAEYMRWDYPDDFHFPGYRDNEYEYAKWENELPF